MKSGWKWGLLAAVAVALLLGWRLSTLDLQHQLIAQLEEVLQQPLSAGRAKFTLAHGLGLRLYDIKIGRTPSWRMQAQWADIELDMTSLMLGRVQAEGIDIMGAQVKLPIKGTGSFPRLNPKLHLDRLLMRSASIELGNGRFLVHDALIDVRDLGGNAQPRWEINARLQSGDAQSHGQAKFVDGEVATAFGKLKLSQVRLPTALAARLPAGFSYHQLNTALTFELAAGGLLQIFGDLTLPPPNNDMPEVNLRGKLAARLGRGEINWHDGIAHIGGTAIAAEGACRDGDCRMALHTKAAHLRELAAVLPRLAPAKGRVDADMQLTWRHKDWSLSGRLQTKRMAWKDVHLPMLDVDVQGLRGRGERLLALQQAQLTQSDKQGSVVLTGFHLTWPEMHGRIRVNQVHDWWAEMIPAVAALLGRPLQLQGEGMLQGEVRLAHSTKETAIGFDLDGGAAMFRVRRWLGKPKDVAATVQGRWRTRGGVRSLDIAHAQLADSSIIGLRWRQNRRHQTLTISKLAADFSRLYAQGVALPEGWQSLHGGIRGRLALDLGAGKSWLDGMQASLELANWGLGRHSLSGSIDVDKGLARSERLIWQQGQNRGELSGRLHLAKLEGALNLKHGELHWPQEEPLPDWLRPALIRGSLRDVQLHLFDQDVAVKQAAYHLQQRQLHFDRLKGRWHDGQLRAHYLQLDLGEKNIAFGGYLQLGGVRLTRDEGERLLGSGVSGRLFATVKLHGVLPFTDWRDFRADGDVAVYGGSWYGGDLERALAGGLGDLPQGTTHFSRLEMHVRLAAQKLRIPSLRLQTASWQIRGRAQLAADGVLAGRLRASPIHRQDVGQVLELGGRWPQIQLRLGN